MLSVKSSEDNFVIKTPLIRGKYNKLASITCIDELPEIKYNKNNMK